MIENEGYEDMESFLDLTDQRLQKINKLFKEWAKDQGDSANVYWEGRKRVVVLPEGEDE